MLRPDHLGLAFRFLRTSRHLRQHQVAIQAGITPSMLSGYENGRKQPTLATLEKILLAMGCSLQDLVAALELVKGGKLGAGARPSPTEEERLSQRFAPATPGSGPSLRPLPAAQASGALAPAFDLEMIFGAEPLAREEEEAFGEMLSGYCRWLRFLRRQAGSGCGARDSPTKHREPRRPRLSRIRRRWTQPLELLRAIMQNRWIAYRKPNPHATFRLFCFHYAGGAASVYRTWQEALPAEVEVCAVQLPGRESRLREPAFQSLEPVLDALGGVLEEHFDLPFAFFGHSMGAILSFELAYKLRRDGKAMPRALMLSGRRAPHRPDPDKPIHDLPEEEFKSELRKLNGTPEEVLAHPELMELLSPVLRADFALCETYRHQPEPPLDLPIAAFGGLADAKVAREDLEGWQRYTSAGFRLRMYPGDHFFLNGAAKRDLLRSVAQELAPQLVATATQSV